METNLLLLSSNSPRRRQLLALGGWSFDLDSSDIDETPLADETARDYVRRLAVAKSRAAQPRAKNGQFIIGADTAVVIDSDILGKPVDADQARSMLLRLRGRTHQVFTGLAVLSTSDSSIQSDVVVTDVPMRNYSMEEIDQYIQTGDPLDKAGAYGIQNPDFQPVASMSGCYASVMGLPLCRLGYLMAQVGHPPFASVAQNCQDTIHYDCTVFQNYLKAVPDS